MAKKQKLYLVITVRGNYETKKTKDAKQTEIVFFMYLFKKYFFFFADSNWKIQKPWKHGEYNEYMVG